MYGRRPMACTPAQLPAAAALRCDSGAEQNPTTTTTPIGNLGRRARRTLQPTGAETAPGGSSTAAAPAIPTPLICSRPLSASILETLAKMGRGVQRI